MRILLFALVVIIITFSCTETATKETTTQPSSWTTYLENVGTYSSTRTVDLNNDSVMDIVLGAGGKEELHSDSAVIALDGKTGKILWMIPGSNQYVGSAVFLDINNDNIKDVFIGGRWAQLTAINGASGKPIWSFFPERTKPDGSDGGWFNFTTPQFVPDQDSDKIADIILANGGDARAKPGDPNRPAGRLLVLSSKTGKILANVQVPDGKETYMSVVCEPKGNDMNVLFGTGGETLSGHLFRTTLSDIMKGDISHAKAIASSTTKGFVSSPVLVDMNRDGINDVITEAVDGRLMAIDGATDSVLWQVSFPGTEAYTIPAIGFFNGDSIPDVFANFALGVFPKLEHSIRFMIDGKTGKIEYQDTISAFQYASGVTNDFDGDGIDEVLVSNSSFRKRQFDYYIYSNLLILDFKNHKNFSIGDTLPAGNIASTPWIGDLDNNKKYDIIYAAVKYAGLGFDLERPVGLYVRRFSTDIDIKKAPRWGAFMGSNYTGVY